MDKLLSRLQGRRAALLVLGLGSATLAVFMIGLIGFFSINDKGTDVVAGPTGSAEERTDSTATPGATTDDSTPGAAPDATATGPSSTTGTKSGTKSSTKPGSSTNPNQQPPPGQPFVPEQTPPGEAPLPQGGDATGVTSTMIKYGVHAPITFNNAPVPLAGPVVRGIRAYIKYINDHGGINGRKMDLHVVDDKFTTDGADEAAKELINTQKVFFVAGTLGVDQISVVAARANKYGVPYFAGGGNEPLFQKKNVHQILSSYDTHVRQLADFLAKDPAYKGKRIGTLTSNTPEIAPVVGIFDEALKKHGMKVNVNQTVDKPELQNAKGYGAIIIAFNGKVDVVVPLTDPINTSGLVRQCGYGDNNQCNWTYSFSNFAHDGETALTLFNNEWGRKHVRGLAGGCYANAPDAQLNDPNKCSSMGIAKRQFNEVKQKPDAWTTQQADSDGASIGYNSGAGYQWMFFKKAMLDQGTIVTRQRFMAAIHRYNGYRDLITGPITYKNSPNYAHGAELMAVFEAKDGNKYQMISDGLVPGF